ncbi:hypothetical protein OAG82_01615 [Rubripirellula sp.]|nr:hypothetical protein [Rubripirellula sp.]
MNTYRLVVFHGNTRIEVERLVVGHLRGRQSERVVWMRCWKGPAGRLLEVMYLSFE